VPQDHPFIQVRSLDDPRVADFRNVKDRDLAGRRGVFIAEGDLVVRRLLTESPLRTRAVLVNPQRADSMRDALAARSARIPIYVAEQHVFDEIAGFHIHRGVLAVGDRPPDRAPADLLRDLPDRATVVFLEDLTNHDNVGGVFRCAAAFGASGALLTERCADPLYRKATRVSIGATLTVPFARAPRTTDALAGLHDVGFETIALTPAAHAPEILSLAAESSLPARRAILLGAEGPGLSATALRGARRQIRLGDMVVTDSLNVVVAAGIALHALQD